MDQHPKRGNDYFVKARLESGPDANALYKLSVFLEAENGSARFAVVERFAHELETRPRDLTSHERYVVERLVEAAQAFRELPGLDTSDRAEFDHAIHAAQRIVLARPGVEHFNDHRDPLWGDGMPRSTT